jgi:NADH-quinone oxidoreductase subunit F
MAYPYTHEKEVRILSKHFGEPEARTLEGWKARGGYQTLQKAFEAGREKVIEETKASGLRGRGGAGFPAGVKWSFMPREKSRPHYLLCNADESEPGTFKDRELLRWTPHQVIEGMIIAAYAIQAEEAYVYCRGEFFETTQILAKAVEEAYEGGYLGKDILGSGVNLDITVHCGGGAYICGEETALMNSLEGRRGTPRVKPPFPAQAGYRGMPSTVNNVETLASVPYIIQAGAEAYRRNGTQESPGTKLFCVSGHVRKPGNYELPLGFPLMELIHDVCGGLREGRSLKGVIPGGSSVPILNAEECADCELSFEGVQKAGSQLGCASVIVMDDSADIVKEVRRMVGFYAHESCGQCTPCREGSAWTEKILRRIEQGRGTEEDLDTLMEVTSQMEGTTICVLSDSVAAPVQSSIRKYRDEYLARIRTGERVGAA